jgi:hypothetical protein
VLKDHFDILRVLHISGVIRCVVLNHLDPKLVILRRLRILSKLHIYSQ